MTAPGTGDTPPRGRIRCTRRQNRCPVPPESLLPLFGLSEPPFRRRSAGSPHVYRLPPARCSHAGSHCATQVLSRDLGSCLTTRSLHCLEFLLTSIAASDFRCSADLVCGLGQQLVSLSSLLLHNRIPESGTPGGSIGRCFPSGESRQRLGLRPDCWLGCFLDRRNDGRRFRVPPTSRHRWSAPPSSDLLRAATTRPRAETPSAANPCQSQPLPALGSGRALTSGFSACSVCCSPDSSLAPHRSALARDRAVTRSGLQEIQEGPGPCANACLI